MSSEVFDVLNEAVITPTEFGAIKSYMLVTAPFISPYPRNPEILEEVPSSLNVYDQFYSDWYFSHYLNGFMGEILEVCTIQFDAPSENRLEFIFHGVIKELGDILFYYSGIIRKIPRLYDAMVAINPYHKIEHDKPKSFEDLNDAIMFYGEQFANKIKRHLYYGDPQYSTDFSPYGLDALADLALTVLRCIKAYGDTTLQMIEVFTQLPEKFGSTPQTRENMTLAKKIVASHPSLFAEPRGLAIVMDANIAKLAKRYPTGTFTLKDAIERKDVE